MDFPEVDHNPLMDYPGSMSEILVCCLDTAPRASDQGEFEPSADFLCWLCPFTGRVSCSSAGGEGPQRKSPSLAKQQERCAERRRWEPLNPTSHPEPPRPQSPTGYQAHKTQLAFIRLLHGRLCLDWAKPHISSIPRYSHRLQEASQHQAGSSLSLSFLWQRLIILLVHPLSDDGIREKDI